jgi:LysR family glycine cleavage system transcriptional activator
MTPSFAESWLMPRLGEFWAQHPDIELTLLPGVGLTDLRRDGVDLAIRYGKGAWVGYEAELLASAQFVVVAAKEYIGNRKFTQLADITGVKWLLENERQDQVLWAEEQGLDLSQVRATEFPTATLAYSATRAGYGVSISNQAVVDSDLESGTLVSLFTAASGTFGYYLVTRKETQSKNLTAFIKWLRSCKEKT